MKLVRFGPSNQERPGVLMENESRILDVRAMAFDIEDFNGHFLSYWGIQRLRALAIRATSSLPAPPQVSAPPASRRCC